MLSYIVRRVAESLVLLLVATFVCFALVRLLGDPIAEWATVMMQRDPQGAPVAIEAAYRRAGLDQPFLTRYWNWLSGFVAGDWGTTVNPGRSPRDVRPEILEGLAITARLVAAANILALLLGLWVGIRSAVRRYSWFDYGVTGFSFLVFSMPVFCIAVLLKVAGITLNDALEPLGVDRWLVTAGYPAGGFGDGLGEQLFRVTGVFLLPTLALTAISFALYSRFQRSSMLDSLASDYVRTARAKGLSESAVTYRHALRNALIPVVTVATLNFGAIFSGAVITETVFGWRGMGYLLVENVQRKEPYMILAFLVVTAAFVLLFNLIADICYTILDPRIRLD